MFVSFREALASTLLEVLEKDARIQVITPDLGRALRIDALMERYAGQYVSTGICESSTIGIAAGMAASGLVPIVAGFAMFVAEKPFELLRNMVAYPNLNVKIIATHAGICVGKDGPTHQAAEDIAILRTLPNFKLLCACDVAQTRAAIKAIVEDEGPAYLRLGRDKAVTVYPDDCEVRIGGSDILRDGKDVAIFATGTLVTRSLAAAKRLEEKGISAAVINLYSIKPLDQERVLQYALKCRHVVTTEDHSRFGGLGGAVAEYLAETQPTRMAFVALNDTFAESGGEEELYEKYALDEQAIVEAAVRVLASSGAGRE